MTERRRLVVDLRSTAEAFHLPDWVAARLLAETPEGWHTHVVSESTESFGDGAQQPREEVLSVISEAEIYLGFGMPRSLFLAGKRLRWVHTGTAGVASLLFEEMREGEVQLTNSAGIYGPPIAEHVLGGVLHFLRGFDVAAALRAKREWNQSIFASAQAAVREIDECRVLVIGAGGIGGEVGRRFAGLGATVIGVRRRPEAGIPDGFSEVHGPEAIDRLLPEADVVVLATPLTESTRAVLGAERIGRLRQGAIVCNVARGALIDESALTTALLEGRIRGAVLDVFAPEPLAATSPLWHLPQVLVTPHISGVSPRRFWDRLLTLFLDNWSRYRTGGALRNLVDKRAGY